MHTYRKKPVFPFKGQMRRIGMRFSCVSLWSTAEEIPLREFPIQNGDGKSRPTEL